MGLRFTGVESWLWLMSKVASELESEAYRAAGGLIPKAYMPIISTFPGLVDMCGEGVSSFYCQFETYKVL